MRQAAYVIVLAGFAGISLSGCTAENQPAFTVCESTYALCTTAQCTEAAGETGTVSCACEVETGYSAGMEPCQAETETSEGTQISSRYYPIKSYAACSNDRPWAWCLDKPCLVEKNDPAKASCACTVVKDKGPYLIVTDNYDASTCTTGLWSSATVKDVDQITDFLKTNDDLKPYDLKVLSPE